MRVLMRVLLVINIISAFSMLNIDRGTALINAAAAVMCFISIWNETEETKEV